jgi:membrane associated rhomboid family serine protease
VLLLATRDAWWATLAEAALESSGLGVTWVNEHGVVGLHVEDAIADSVVALLSEQHGEELRKRRIALAPDTRLRPPLLLQPAFAGAFCSAVLLLVVHGIVSAHGAWAERGTMVPAAVLRGEWWRLITAATLHADANHVLHNAAFLVLLGWAAAERVGVGVALFGWLVTAIAGFIVSIWYDPQAISVGASGGLFGLLGIAAGHALRTESGRDFWLRHRMRVIGAFASVLAMTAFGEHANVAAHLGGAGFGAFFGFGLPAKPLSPFLQGVFIVLTCGAVGVAWRATI